MFFIPKRIRPGYYNYKVLVSSLEPEKQRDDCPICFMRLNETVDQAEANAQEGNQNGTNEQSMENLQPLLPVVADAPQLFCLRTPCNHYFHEECLVKWFETKPECPTCRKALPLLESTAN
jgi:Ring finger domain